MSSSVCHAPLPVRMEAFTTRICLRAVDQYEKILQSHFNKPSSGKEPGSGNKEQRRLKNAGSNNIFLQWRRNHSTNTTAAANNNNHSHNVSRSSSAGSPRPGNHRQPHHHHHHHQSDVAVLDAYFNNKNNKNNNNHNRTQATRRGSNSIIDSGTNKIERNKNNNNNKNENDDRSNLTTSTATKTTTTTATATSMSLSTTMTTIKAATTAWPPPADRATLRKLEQFPLVLSDASMPEEDLSLKFLALNALDLTAPASDVLLKNRLKSWFQLSGHPDGFAPAGPGTVWKRRTGGPENTERMVYEALSKDEALKDCIPRYYREVEYRGETFIELQDLLFGFTEPHVMDIKLGTRTFLESEVSKTTARPDLYKKMIAVDPNAPTPEEHERGAVTKLRYMQFREQQSSTCSHGFRIEAMKLPGAPPITDLKTLKSHRQVLDTMRLFLGGRRETRRRLLDRLRELRSKVEQSEYFLTHEVIGSSIFMIYDNDKVGVWLIDFAKTCEVPKDIKLTHRREWQQGNHEEGFLLGLDNLISTIEEIE